jgi:hypothetical protein
MNERNRNWTILSGAIALSIAASAFAEATIPELFCMINDSGEGLTCQYKDKRDSSKSFDDSDIISFMDRANSGAFMTVKSKRGFERTFEIDPQSAPFKRLRNAKKDLSVSDTARMKLDVYTDLEKKAIQISDGLDTVFIQSDMLKYDPAVANDKCKMDMKVYNSGQNYEKNIESISAENKALSIYLTSILKAFKEPGSCMGDYKIDVASDGSVELSQLQGLSQAFRNRCKRKI